MLPRLALKGLPKHAQHRSRRHTCVVMHREALGLRCDLTLNGLILVKMKAVRHLGFVLLLLLSCAAPLMACVNPESEMTAAERACCRMMHDQCAQMGMPASHNCCAKVPPAVFENALKSNSVRFHPVAVLVFWTASFDILASDIVSWAWIHSPEHWPPKSPPVAITVLRI